MAAIKQKKSAYEEALDFVKSGASNLASGFKKSAQPVAQSASNFYSNFSKGLQNYGAQQDAQARQRQQQATNFAKNIVSFGSQAKNNLANNFAGNINAIKQIPQATRESIKIAPISIKKIIPTAKQGIGSFAVTASQAPARSTGIPILDIANFATGGKLTPGAGTIGQKLPGLRPAGTQMAREGYQEQQAINQQINEAVPQLDESRSLSEKIQDPRWVARGLTMNAPSFLTSVGLSAATGVLTRNPALTTAVLFGSSQLQNAGDAYGDAIQNGATEEEAANLATFVGTINGILDTIGMGKVLERIPGGDKVKSSILKYAMRNIIEGSFSEGSTESIQQMVQNAVARAYYDHKRDILANVSESGFFGVLMGGGASGAVDTANIGTGNIQQEEPVAPGVSPTAPQFRVNTGPMHPEDITVASDAIKFLERSRQAGDIQDYMDPIYQKSVNDLKLLAGHYIGPQYAKNTPIETIAQEMRNRIEIDTGDIKNAQIEAGLDNNLSKNLTEKLQKPPEAQDPAVQAIESDIDQALTRDVGQTVVAQPSYDTTPASNEAFDMKKEDISGALKSVLSDQEIEILNPKGIIVTPDGQIAEGKYFDSMIAVVEEGGKVKSQTVYHEAFHALVDKVADKATYQAAIDEMRAGNKMSENEAIEKLAEDFPKFVRGEAVGGGAETALFNGLINSVHKIRNAQNTAQLVAQSRPTQPVQIGITSAQAASPMTASIVEEGNKLFEAGQVDEGFAKLQEATDSTKGELESLLAEGNTQINRLETGTHGLYFGVPEPSFWLNITPENMDVALGKTAQFAKNHGQESFITASHSFAGESLGVELKFKPNLTNQDIIAIEKIVNDSGMGFTVNQNTGEAVAYNINQFDGMDQETWLKAAHTAIDALQSNGFITNAVFDNYDVNVYTKDTYDNLISRGSAQVSNRGESTIEGQGTTPRNTSDTTGSTDNVPTESTDQTSGAKFRQVTPPPVEGFVPTPQKETPGPGQKERGLVESIREEPTNIPDVRSGVSGAYDTTTDKGRIQFGQEAIKKDYQGSVSEVLSDTTSLTNEIQGKGYALFQDLQKRAMEAKNAGKNDEYEFLKNQAIEIGNAMARKATPAAQALQFFHLWSQSSPESMVDWAKGIFEQANEIKNLSIGRGIKAATGLLTGNKSWKLTLTKEMEQHIRDKMADIYMIADKDARAKATAELMKEVTKGIPTPVMTLIDAYRYQNALSGVRTHLRNLTSNTFNSTVVRPLVLLDMAAWDTVKGMFTGKKGEHSFKEIPVYYRSLLGATKEAQNAFMDTWRDSGAVFGKGDQPLDENYASFNTLMQDRVPGYLNVTGRALEGADRYFTTLIRNAEYARLLSQGVSESEAMTRAQKMAEYTLYRNQLDPKNKSGQGKILSGIDAITNFIMKGRNLPIAGPLMKLFVMFLRVPMAVAKMSLEFNPATGPLTAIGAANKAEQFAKARIGASIMMMGALAAMAGRTTWEAPTDEEEKRKFYDSGRKPYSFLLDTPAGQVWVPFSYLGPFGIVFGTGAAAKHYFADSKTALTDSNMQKAGKVLLSGLQQWSQQTPLSGVGGFVRTMQGDIDYKVMNNLSFSSGQFVPLNSLLGDVTHWIDPTFRKPRGYLEGLAKNIPGLSQNLDPITNSMGEPAQRNITDKIFPWSMGKATPEFEQQYQDVLSENQLTSEANYYKKQGEQELENALRDQGIPVNKVSGGTGSAQQKGAEAQKKNVDTLLKAYEEATSEDTQKKIRNSLEQRYGVNFDEVYQNYLTKDTQIHQKGLAEGVEKKLERSKEFTYVRKLRDKFDGSGIGGDFLNETMQKHNISQDDLDYDDKTLLPDDVQLDEIKSMTEGLSGEPLFTLLVSMRRVSEGSRKALLTDGLIGDLADENVISDAQAKQLKRIIWDSGKGTYKLKPGGGLSKSDLTIKFDVPDIKKTGVSLGKGFSGGGNEKGSVSTPKTGFTRIKVPKAPGIQFQPTRSTTSGIRLRTPVKTLSGLGGK